MVNSNKVVNNNMMIINDNRVNNNNNTKVYDSKSHYGLLSNPWE